MTTDTKAVTRWDAGPGVNPRANGKYVLFTDHERVVGELEERAVNMKNWARHDREMIEVLETELETLRTALAASRAEVERIRGYEVGPLEAKNAELRAELAAKSKDADVLADKAMTYLTGAYHDPEVEPSDLYMRRRVLEAKQLSQAIEKIRKGDGNV